jgi:ferredoxin
MGHIAGKQAYLDLQKRLDRMPIGAPAHRAFYEILEELFTEEECRLAAVMPMKLSRAETIARKAGLDPKRVEELLGPLSEKGLVADIPFNGTVYYTVNPAMVGFFEFSMMRVRKKVDQKKLAGLMWEYIKEDPKLAFMRMVAEGDTFFARPAVHMDSLEPEVFSEVLDYERAEHLVAEAGSWAEGMCHCRHIKDHLGKRCDIPMDLCLSLGMGADYLVRNGIAKPISKERALDVIKIARELNLVQMADNVKNRPTFICNCCKCCCEMMEGFRTLPQQAKVVSSSYVAKIHADTCTGCGKCEKVCPVDAITHLAAEPTDKAKKRKKRSVVDEDSCIGCGVCYRNCKFDALSIEPMPKRVYIPETMMEKMMMQAVERGKLPNVLFDDPSKVTHRTLGAFFRVILAMPPAKQLLADQQLRSKFVRKMLEGFSRTKQGWMSKV